MDRMACVSVPALPLQLVLRADSEGRNRPIVVLDQDRAQGQVLWANAPARACGIRRGMRYAAGLARCDGLQGRTVSEVALAAAVKELVRRLTAFSPGVEPSPTEPGVAWLDATGLIPLYPSLGEWAQHIRADLAEAGLHATIAVGFTRFGTYAAAQAGRRTRVFAEPADETDFVRTVPLERLGAQAPPGDTCLALGLHTLGDLLALPADQVARLGPEVAGLQAWARGAGWQRLQPLDPRPPVRRTVNLEAPEDTRDRLLAMLHGPLEGLVAEVGARPEQIRALHVGLDLEDGGQVADTLVPATPTRDPQRLANLLALRLEREALDAGVVAARLEADSVPVTVTQIDLFAATPQRARASLDRALARLRTVWGESAVVIARVQDAHLPEARFRWEPLTHRFADRPREGPRDADRSAPAPIPVIRRIYDRPQQLPEAHRELAAGWFINGAAYGPVEEIQGRAVIAGGWWVRETARVYHYVRTGRDRWWWVYRDTRRRRWFLQGGLE